MNKTTKVSTLIIALYMLISFSSCGIINGYLKHDSIIEKLQEEVPFKIIIPTYLPDGIPRYPKLISGPGERSNVDSTVVGLCFFPDDDSGVRRAVSIWEENYIINNISSDPSSIYLDIEEVRVLEEEIADFDFANSEDASTLELAKGISYRWNKHGINYTVDIYGYDREECLKIVESMITQIE